MSTDCGNYLKGTIHIHPTCLFQLHNRLHPALYTCPISNYLKEDPINEYIKKIDTEVITSPTINMTTPNDSMTTPTNTTTTDWKIDIPQNQESKLNQETQLNQLINDLLGFTSRDENVLTHDWDLLEK